MYLYVIYTMYNVYDFKYLIILLLSVPQQQSSEQIEKQFLDSMYLISHSDKTKITYKTALNHFRNFAQSEYNTNDTDIILKIKSDELDVYQVIRNFAVYLDKKNLKAQGLKSYISGLKGYLRHWGIRINSDDYKQLVKLPRVTRTREIPITKEMILRILRNSPPKLQMAILLSCSSGLRIGEIVQLKISDIDFESTPVKLNIRAEIAKGGSSRETYITAETTNALKDYLKRNFGWQGGQPNWTLQDGVIFRRLSEDKIGVVAKNPAQSFLRASIKYSFSNL